MRSFRSCMLLFLAAGACGFSVLSAPDGVRSRAEGGDAAAQLELARDFLYGLNGEKRNPATGFFWLKRAAASGDAEALYNLGYCYEFGTGTDRDRLEAYVCYEKAARSGLAPARFRLAEMLHGGIPPSKSSGFYRSGVAADPERAKTLLNALVTEEYPPALYLLAEELLRSASPDNANAAAAVKLLRTAADNGDVMAMRLLADCLFRGVGTDPDQERMAFYLGEAAKRGDAESMAFLGLAYEYGLGVRPDPERAFELTRTAASSGVPAAQLRMADYYLSGVYVPTDVQQALGLLREAAEKNEPRAIFRLGNCYANGIGVDRDDRKAFELYLRAAAAGEINASIALALAFRNGVGTPKDASAVAYWLRRAAAAGSREAEEMLKETGKAAAD